MMLDLLQITTIRREKRLDGLVQSSTVRRRSSKMRDVCSLVHSRLQLPPSDRVTKTFDRGPHLLQFRA